MAVSVPTATTILRQAARDESIDIGDYGLAASQPTVTRTPHAAATKRVSDEVAVDVKASATLRSAGGKGAGAWIVAPSQPDQLVSNMQFCIALRTRLHMTIPQCIGNSQRRKQDGSLYGALLDPNGYHARICRSGGWIMKRHDAASALLGSWCEDTRERAQMDLVLHTPGLASPFFIVLTVVSALSSDALTAGSAV